MVGKDDEAAEKAVAVGVIGHMMDGSPSYE